MIGETPPHPAAAQPPSPARGEGKEYAAPPRLSAKGEGKRSGVNPKANRAKFCKHAAGFEARRRHKQPSPLAGEGGETRRGEPGEGASKAETARQLRRQMTEAEQALWRLLRNRRLNGVKFRRQVPVGPYIADFLCFEARLIVEADGGQHAASPHDEVRDAWLKEQGFRLLRFWNSEILTNPEGVLIQLVEALVAIPPTRRQHRRLLPQLQLPFPSGERATPARAEGLLLSSERVQ